MKYGMYTVTTRGNGFTALVVREDDGAEVFFQGEEAIEFLDYIEAAEDMAEDHIHNYFLGIDEAGGWEFYSQHR